jgi:hypothetical protein
MAKDAIRSGVDQLMIRAERGIEAEMAAQRSDGGGGEKNRQREKYRGQSDPPVDGRSLPESGSE